MMDAVSRISAVAAEYLQNLMKIFEGTGWFSTGPLSPFINRDSHFYPWFLAIFVLGGIVVYFLSRKRDEHTSLTAALKFVFPAPIYRHPSTRTDFWGYIISFSLFVPAFAALAAMILTGDSLFDWFVHTLGSRKHVLLVAGSSVVAVQVVAFLVVEDFLFYLYHFAFHKVPALWRLHRAHHSAEVLNPLTANRFHPLELATIFILLGGGLGVASGIIMYVTGAKFGTAAISLIFAAHFAKNIMQNFRHSHIWISYGQRLNGFFISPCMHQLHHSTLLKHRDKNLGQTLAIWDRIFGTLYVPNGREYFPLGISEDEIKENNPHRTLRNFYIEPVVTMMHALFGRAS